MIQVGKYYLNGYEKCIGPMQPYDPKISNNILLVDEKGFPYLLNGKYLGTGSNDSLKDLKCELCFFTRK